MNPLFPTVRRLGRQDYTKTLKEMQAFTAARSENSDDEVWIVEHPPVFTLGLTGKREHILDAGDIPVVQTDRGGQVTYHGPGQIVVYLMVDIRRLGLGVRQLVSGMEDAVIHLLSDYGIAAARRKDAPGVYVNGDKIAALGLRIKRGYSYHGLALNVDMDLSPFTRINPCGYDDIPITQLSRYKSDVEIKQVSDDLLAHLMRFLGRG